MSTEFLFGAVLLFAVAYLLLPRPFRPVFLTASTIAFVVDGGGQAAVYFFLSGLSAWLAAMITYQLRTEANRKARQESDREKKHAIKKRAARFGGLCVGLALTVQFSLLVFLKLLPDLPQALASFFFGREARLPRLFAPIGISFYTFMFASYMFDVHSGKLKAQKNPLRVFLFAGYPPQLIQGPIGRFGEMDRQFFKTTPVGIEDVRRGLLLMLFGLFKKKVVADRAAGFVSAVFDTPTGNFGGAAALLAVLLYSLQQYCDFSGGIDIVIGGTRMMGIRMPDNFRRPYFSASLAEFWRRWHITLGTWMRDYVFYPIALSKPVSGLAACFKKASPTFAKVLPAVIANLFVFLLVGLWHGINEHYVVWGLYNGVIIGMAVLLEPVSKALNRRFSFTSSQAFHVFRVLRTFLIVNIGWFFDRSASAGQAIALLRSLGDFRPEQLTLDFLSGNGLSAESVIILIGSGVFLFVLSLMAERGADIPEKLMQLPMPVRWTLIFVFVLCIVLFFDTGNTRTFMYAAF